MSEILARQYRRLLIASSDWAEAREYLSELIATLNGDYGESWAHLPERFQRTVKDSLSISFTLSYSRPFLNSRGDDATHRVSSRVLSGFEDTHRALHSKIMEIRMNTFAHSDSDGFLYHCDDSRTPTIRFVVPPQPPHAPTLEHSPEELVREWRKCFDTMIGQDQVSAVTMNGARQSDWFTEDECWIAWSMIQKLMDDIGRRMDVLEQEGVAKAA